MRTATCFATPDPEATHHVHRAVTLAGKWLINVNQTVATGSIFDKGRKNAFRAAERHRFGSNRPPSKESAHADPSPAEATVSRRNLAARDQDCVGRGRCTRLDGCQSIPKGWKRRNLRSGLELAEHLDLPLEPHAAGTEHPSPHGLAEELEIIGGGCSGVDQKVAVHLGNHCSAYTKPAATS